MKTDENPDGVDSAKFGAAFKECEAHVLRRDIIDNGHRVDGRALDKVRAAKAWREAHGLSYHIEVDGGHHGAISLRMVELLCGDDDRKWTEAAQAAQQAIEARLQLWDGIVAQLGAAK